MDRKRRAPRDYECDCGGTCTSVRTNMKSKCVSGLTENVNDFNMKLSSLLLRSTKFKRIRYYAYRSGTNSCYFKFILSLILSLSFFFSPSLFIYVFLSEWVSFNALILLGNAAVTTACKLKVVNIWLLEENMKHFNETFICVIGLIWWVASEHTQSMRGNVYCTHLRNIYKVSECQLRFAIENDRNED